jgi:two-component system cell cycle sensor histidine kinase/response regulator CckA
LAIDMTMGYQHPYSIFYVVVLWSAWYGGLGPGLLATTLGGIAIALLGIFTKAAGASASFLDDFEFYWIVCLAASILFEAQRRAQRKSAANAAIAQERWRALAHEIVHRREAEEAAERAQEQFRLAFQYAPVGICQIDLDGRIVEVNPLFCDITGWSRAELLNRPFLDVLYRSESAGGADRCLSFQRGDALFVSQEKSYERPDGATLWVGWAMSTVRGADNRPEGAIAVLADITSRKRAEEEALRTQKLESVAMLAGGIAHDFNNLMTAVLGNASLAMDTMPEGSEVRNMLQGVVAAAERAARLTSQLLAYAGRGAVLSADLDLSSAVASVCELVRPSVPPNVRLQLDLGEGLPRLCADASQIQQLVTNLVLNAVEAIPENRPGAVRVSTGRIKIEEPVEAPVGEIVPGEYLFIQVQDDGSGMEQSILPKLFDPFFSTRFLGRGLGLAAVAGIVRSMKGAIRVSTTVGVGSTFTVLLPLP